MKSNSITLNVLADITRKIASNSVYSDRKKVLLVFNGSNIDLCPRVSELRKLKEEGIVFDLAFSFMSENIVDKERLVRELEPENVYGEEDVFDLEKIEGEYSYLIGPNVTINTMSKLATGMIDSFVASLIWTFLYKGKKVYLDYGAVNNYLGEKSKNPAIQRMIDGRIDSLREMGVVEIEEGSYLETMGPELDEKKESIDIDRTTSTLDIEKNEKTTKNRVITAGDIENLSETSQLVLKKGDILTPLARDRARELDIEVKINR